MSAASHQPKKTQSDSAGGRHTQTRGSVVTAARGGRHSHSGRTRAATGGRRRGLFGLFLGLRVVVALLAVGVLVGSGYAWSTVRHFTSSIQTGAALPVPTPQVVNGKKVAPAKDFDGKDENILLLGNDSIAGATPAEVTALGTTDDRSDSATDTMMIMHIPANGSNASIVSFPRDTWVNIPGFGMDKLNAAYADAYQQALGNGASTTTATSDGIALVAQTLDQLTGLSIDHYVQVNLLGFYEISEAIQGVSVCLNAAQYDADSGINLHAGWNTIEGKQALAFVRQRHGLPGGDLDRIKRQQYFLSAVLHKVTSAGTLLSPTKINSVLKAVSKSLFVDPKLNVITFMQQFQGIAEGNIKFATIPIVDPGAWEGDQQVVEVDPNAVKQFVSNLVGVPLDPKLAGAAITPAAETPVTVLNETNQELLATKNVATLKGYGFPATVGDTSATIDATVIQYPDGMQGQAKSLARYVPGAQLVLTPGITSVTLALGANGVQVKAPATPASPGASSTKPAAPKTSSPPPSASASTSGVTTAQQNVGSCIN